MALSADPHPSFTGRGSYAIIFLLKSGKNLSVGKLGKVSFPKGYYVYVGSALGPGGLKSRIHHHLRVSANPRWHVDYLRPIAFPIEVWTSQLKKRLEHDWASVLSLLKGATIPAPGFGSSDCKCKTHLFHFTKVPSFQAFRRLCGYLYADAYSIKRIKFF